MALTEKMKNDQTKRLNLIIMRLRHLITEAVNDLEITKAEGLIAIDCVREEILKALLSPAKLPAPERTENETHTPQ